jgi:nicotinamidase-related amidase
MASLPVRHTALIVVDVQRAFDELEAGGKRRNNPEALKHIKGILAHFRAKHALIIHVRHACPTRSRAFGPNILVMRSRTMRANGRVSP